MQLRPQIYWLGLDIADTPLMYNGNAITELSVFGSAIRDDFNDDSDVDILVSFDENSMSTIKELKKNRELKPYIKNHVIIK